jgi:pyruvate/2-oxoglutarate dehydrogenase complex dihydrolipoamide acyltransferase (E2) component
LGQLGQGAGQAAGGLGQGATQNGSSDQGQAGGQQDDGIPAGAGSGGLAKEVAKTVAREIRHAASDEARELGLAATRKVRGLAERREHRRADKYNVTETALRVADELGIDLADVEGTGNEGRITVKDVRHAQAQET